METFFIKPKDGLIVRDPQTAEPLPADGAEKPCTSYWLRRERDGSVERVKPAKKAKA